MSSKRKTADTPAADVHVVEPQSELPIGKVLMPGDSFALPTKGRTRLGAGVVQQVANLAATRAGILRDEGNNKIWIDQSQRRYMPMLEDNVLGIVREKQGEKYKIDIGASHAANLDFLAFEGATKRNRPNLQIGALIYARVVLANKDMEPEISCISPQYKKEWMTGQAVFGEVTGGYVFECPTALCRNLLDDNCVVLQCLGRFLAFELAVGVNGRVWVNSKAARDTIVVSNAILNSHNMSAPLVEAMVSKLVSKPHA
jgi:exosome complex component RRP40